MIGPFSLPLFTKNNLGWRVLFTRSPEDYAFHILVNEEEANNHPCYTGAAKDSSILRI